MKIIGQHGEFGWIGPPECPQPVPQRQIEIDENERISVRVKNKVTGEEKEVIGYFMPGVLTLQWERGTKLTWDEPFIGSVKHSHQNG